MAQLRKVIIGACSTICSGSAFAAAFLTGNDLFTDCSATETIGSVICHGYVVGAADAFAGADLICIPKNVSQGQVADIVTKFLRDHPESRHYSASSEVLQALMEAFPCKNQPWKDKN
jgi:hypothetical protein